MGKKRIFICYSRSDAEAVRWLAAELGELGQDVWLDEALSGGQPWWDTILDRIRACDCFVFALSPASWRSRACRSELGYAHALLRPILPVVVRPVPDELLPPFLAQTQWVDIGAPNKLGRALLELPDPPPLPATVPASPEVPISYLGELARKVDAPELTLVEQRNILGELKARLATDERDGAMVLVRELRARSDVYAAVQAEADVLLASLPPPDPRSATPLGVGQYPAAAAPKAERKGRAGVLVASSILAISSVVGGSVWLAVGRSSSEEVPNPSSSASPSQSEFDTSGPSPDDSQPLGPDTSNTSSSLNTVPATNPASPDEFGGVAGSAHVQWIIAGIVYDAVIETDGLHGLATVQYLDPSGTAVAVEEDLTLGQEAGVWWYVGSAPHFVPSGQAAGGYYAADFFRLVEDGTGAWVFDAVCDASQTCTVPPSTSRCREPPRAELRSGLHGSVGDDGQQLLGVELVAVAQ